jgi:hypothetical protein
MMATEWDELEAATSGEARQALHNAGVNEYGKTLQGIAEGVLDGVREAWGEQDSQDASGGWIRDRLDESGRMHEIADGAVPIWYSAIMDAGAESLEIATAEPECGPAFDGERTAINLIAGNLYEMNSNIAHQEADRLAREWDNR